MLDFYTALAYLACVTFTVEFLGLRVTPNNALYTNAQLALHASAQR